MNAREWADYQKTCFYNKGGYTDEQIAALGDGTDWQDAMLQTALRQSHELSVTGGSAKGRYAFSASSAQQDGVIINSGFDRYNLHINADWTLNDVLDFGLSANYGKSTQDGLTTTESVAYNSSPYSAGITNSFVYGLLMPPVVPVRNADGSYNYSNPYEYAYFAIGDKAANAVSDLENSVAQSINSYLLSNVWAQASHAGFVARVAIGFSREQIRQNYFSPSYTSLGLANDGMGGIGNKANEICQQEYTLTWAGAPGDSHYLDALVGYTSQKSTSDYNSVMATHFTNEDLKHNNLADGSEVYPPKSGATEARLHSIIARVNYTLLDRYNATATVRADKSSRFAGSHRWGCFPSLGLSWNADREGFLAGSPTVSQLKARASFGVVGNQEIGDYEYSLSYTAGHLLRPALRGNSADQRRHLGTAHSGRLATQARRRALCRHRRQWPHRRQRPSDTRQHPARLHLRTVDAAALPPLGRPDSLRRQPRQQGVQLAGAQAGADRRQLQRAPNSARQLDARQPRQPSAAGLQRPPDVVYRQPICRRRIVSEAAQPDRGLHAARPQPHPGTAPALCHGIQPADRQLLFGLRPRGGFGHRHGRLSVGTLGALRPRPDFLKILPENNSNNPIINTSDNLKKNYLL